MPARWPARSLGLCVAGLSIWWGGLAGPLFLLLALTALLPGLPVGWRIFGRNHAAGWIAGALIGHAAAAVLFWAVPWATGRGDLPVLAAAWTLGALTSRWAWSGWKGRPPVVELPSWTGRDARALLLVAHLAPLVLALPYARAGVRDAEGAQLYRAYFTADFVWHMALTREIGRLDGQPKNPYVAAEPLHYYYTYFMLPAVLSGGSARSWIAIDAALKVQAAIMAVLVASTVFLVAWCGVPRAGPASAAAVLAIVAGSWEGAYALLDLVRRQVPLTELWDTNIDAVTTWWFQGLRIDGLIRSMWWTPQHALSFSLGAFGVMAASYPGEPSWRKALWVGVPLGGSVACNPFLGAMFCLVLGLTLSVDALFKRLSPVGLLVWGAAAVPVSAALAWTTVAGMSGGADAAVRIGFHDLAGKFPLFCLFLSLGGLLVPAAVGALPKAAWPWRPVLPGLIAGLVAVVLMHVLRLSDGGWVSFRMGNLSFALLPMVVARGLAVLGSTSSMAAGALFTLLLIAGAPTTVIDVINAQDVTNRREGPIGPWTLALTADQQAGLRWVERMTPTDAVVQMDPVVRDRRQWSLLPSFAGRRLATGLPISLLPSSRQEEQSNEVHSMIRDLPATEGHAVARALGIDYLWIDQDDAAEGRVEAIDRFAARPDLFPLLFRRGPVRIYRVR